jgi:hypothetical protein
LAGGGVVLWWGITSINKQHADAVYMTMTMMRPGLFFQREGPGSEPGSSRELPVAGSQ